MDPTTDLHVHTRLEGPYTIVAIDGELDIATAYTLRERLLDILHRDDTRIVVDLSGVSFCDVSGLATLVATKRRARLLGGTLRLAAPRPQVRTILRLTGLHRHLAVYPTTAAACASLDPDEQPALR
ncbi:MAG: anti-sigma factor antagonist [Streptosporangiales bacterium]|nr:anti-sigma factor antagonist [Streptosporangiales bacterium]